MEKCTNCGSLETEKLNETGKQGLRTVMSDGSFAENFNAAQHICKHCGSIFITYNPPNRLEQYFSEEYDVSDEVQNCQVVTSGTRQGKHSLIHNSLLNSCKNLSAKGNFLEIACGNGLLSEKFAKEHLDWNCVAIDPSNHSAQIPHEKVRFVKNFFDPALFKDETFDVIVAHGILNRTPPLKMLRGISSIANQDALISLEIVTLENSIFAPYIWDHSYTFLEKVFISYLDFFGIRVCERVNCGPTIQFICKYDDTHTKEHFTDQQTIESSLSLYREHLMKWDCIKNNFLTVLERNPGKKIALFGAGLYNAVMVSKLGKAKFDFVIDEIRAGRFFDGMKIISLEEAMKIDEEIMVSLCTRPSNLDYIKEKLENKGLTVFPLL